MNYRTPNLNHHTFASTNAQTVAQRLQLLQELVPQTGSLAELCCGDCYRQWHAYTEWKKDIHFLGLDVEPTIVARNRARGIPCIQGDVLDKEVLAQFRDFAVVFFGPPLSEDCDGHRLLPFREIVPGYLDVARLLLGELMFNGLFICICPKSTSMGDIKWLYDQIRRHRAEVGLRLIHHSYSTLRGNGEITAGRLKYIELWFSAVLPDAWELRISQPERV